jgi:hypothetical protein
LPPWIRLRYTSNWRNVCALFYPRRWNKIKDLNQPPDGGEYRCTKKRKREMVTALARLLLFQYQYTLGNI